MMKCIWSTLKSGVRVGFFYVGEGTFHSAADAESNETSLKKIILFEVGLILH